jgi:hypothetical protein
MVCRPQPPAGTLFRRLGMNADTAALEDHGDKRLRRSVVVANAEASGLQVVLGEDVEVGVILGRCPEQDEEVDGVDRVHLPRLRPGFEHLGLL